MAVPPSDARPDDADVESTARLFIRIRGGDSSARDELVARFLPSLQRWARGRVPKQVRHLADTDDLVQESLVAALGKVDSFDARRTGAFFAYLTQIMRNRIRDYIRSAGRRPAGEELTDDQTDFSASPLEDAIGHESWSLYLKALESLPESQKAAVVLRVELGLDFRAIADAIDSPSANAARMTVTRAIKSMAEVMDER